jgi:NAD/NADP transhydrogenase alpha subunit
MKIGVIKESDQGEAAGGKLVPNTVARLVKAGFEVIVENGAGISANFADSAYSAVGAALSENSEYIYETADIILKVVPPSDSENRSPEKWWYPHRLSGSPASTPAHAKLADRRNHRFEHGINSPQ